MKAMFRVADHPLLLEAVPGSLFTPVGPELVECVCAVQSQMTDGCVGHASSDRDLIDPEGSIAVVVVACRVEPGEPEYFPPGFTMRLPSAAPITFLSPSAPVRFSAAPLGGPVITNSVQGFSFENRATAAPLVDAVAHHPNLARWELGSRL